MAGQDKKYNPDPKIHPFREGNTRTTAVFTIKYLRSLGFKANNTPFEQNAKYFRDALARANYRNTPKGVDYDFTGLTRFFSNLLYGTQYPLNKRYLHVDAIKSGLVLFRRFRQRGSGRASNRCCVFLKKRRRRCGRWRGHR